jgi:hypothetical protein
MLHEYRPNKIPPGKLGEGGSICFQCKDALAIYHEAISRGLEPKTPFVGNAMWVTILSDPVGYTLDFETPTTPRRRQSTSRRPAKKRADTRQNVYPQNYLGKIDPRKNQKNNPVTNVPSTIARQASRPSDDRPSKTPQSTAPP